MTSECKYCLEPIDFTKLETGRWMPTDPVTRKRHECQLEQRCEDCQQPFMGAPWKKKCSKCWKADQPDTRGFKQPAEKGNFGDPGVRSTSRYDTKVYPPKQSETLKPDDDYFDDIPS